MAETETVRLTAADIGTLRLPDVSCHKEAAVAAAGMPITYTHPHRCASCGVIFTALNSYDDRPQAAAPVAE